MARQVARTRTPSWFFPAIALPLAAPILSLASWALVARGWLFALRSVDVNLGFSRCSGSLAVVVIVQIASLIPGGIGIWYLLMVSFW